MELYKLDFPNGKSYIGITSSTAKRRFRSHCQPAHRKNPVQFAIHKYGKQNVKLTVLSSFDNWELLCLAEQEAIEKYKTTVDGNGYNVTLGGDGDPIVNIYGQERKQREKWDNNKEEKNAERREKANTIDGKKKARQQNEKRKTNGCPIYNMERNAKRALNKDEANAKMRDWRARQKQLKVK